MIGGFVECGSISGGEKSGKRNGESGGLLALLAAIAQLVFCLACAREMEYSLHLLFHQNFRSPETKTQKMI